MEKLWDNIIWRYNYTIPWDTQHYNHIKHISQGIHASTAKLIHLKCDVPPKTHRSYRATLKFGFWLLLTFKIQDFSRFKMFIVQNTISVHETFYRSKTMLLTNQITAISQNHCRLDITTLPYSASFARSSSLQLLNKAILQLQQSAYVTYLIALLYWQTLLLVSFYRKFLCTQVTYLGILNGVVNSVITCFKSKLSCLGKQWHIISTRNTITAIHV